MREALLPYLVAGVNMLTPTLAARDLLFASSKNAPAVFITAITLILVGLPCSIFLRRKGYNRILFNILVQVPLLAMTWSLMHDHPGFQIDWSNPIASAMSGDGPMQLEALLLIFVLLAAGRAFLIMSSEDMIQTPIPGIIIFLLTVVTSGLNESDALSLRMALYMLAYFASSIFIISHEHTLRWQNARVSLGFQRRLLGWTLIFSIVLAPIVIGCALLIQPFNMETLARAGARGLPHLPFRLFGGGNVGIGFDRNLTVGGGDWPAGKQDIMTVTLPKSAPTNLLWRGGTYATYLGGQWLDTPVMPSAPSMGGQEATPLFVMSAPPVYLMYFDRYSEAGDPGIRAWLREKHLKKPPKSWLVHQQFAFQAQSLGGHLPIYSAFQFDSATSSDASYLQARVNDDGSVYLDNMPPHFHIRNYEVDSVIKPSPTTLGWKLKERLALPSAQQQAYTQLPDGVGSRFSRKLRALALEILSKSDRPIQRMTDFDKVRQIELYLGQHYKYTLTPKAPRQGEDPLEYFLFSKEKQGYCVYFSGAMVLLCRSIGIPARMAVGYATGEPSEVKSPTGEGAQVVYHVSSDQAHAWAEVFLSDYGWYSSDPTSGSTPIASIWSKSWDFLIEIVNAVKNGTRYCIAVLQQNATLRVSVFGGGALLLLLLGGLLFLRRDHPPAYPKRELTPAEARAQIRAAYHRMHRWMRRWGVTKPHGFTAREFERAFKEINTVMSEPVSTLSALYIRAEYSNTPIGDADARQAIDLLYELWRLARHERKHLHRAEVEG